MCAEQEAIRQQREYTTGQAPPRAAPGA
jgi:hypothetical protein